MSNDPTTDILVLGATGYTGRLITRYLSAHPQRAHFTLALGARSKSKLDSLVQELNLPSSIKLLQVDVMQDEDSIDRAVRQVRVVINTVGPYWLYGTPVVRSCVKHGVHYVDLTGEAAWMREIIRNYDFHATKTHAIIVPSCGFDSVPSDISVHLSNKTLKSLPSPRSSSGNLHQIGSSVSAFALKGGISGGTIASMITALSCVPKETAEASDAPFALSPFVGKGKNGKPLGKSVIKDSIKPFWTLRVPGERRTILGGFFLMAPGNIQLVQRTYGLLELQERMVSGTLSENLSAQAERMREARLMRYGPQFNYEEFMVVKSRFAAIMVALGLGLAAFLVSWAPTRWLVKKIVPQSGDGPSDADMQHGFFTTTNLTTSASDPSVKVKTVIKGKGDPGYLLTAIMISESALSILLPPVSKTKSLVHPYSAPRDADRTNRSSLTPLARQGGILTPMSAFGDVLIQRLEESGRFEFSSCVVQDEDEGRKRR